MYNVLVCDDEKDIVSALQIYLKSEGYQVFSAYNGKEALKIINREDIQLVLMDIMMPEMRGDELCQAIKNNIETSHIPVILLTALNNEKDMRDFIQTVAKVTNQSLDQRKIDKLIKIMQNKDVLNDVEKMI